MNSNTSVLPPMIRSTSSVARFLKVGLATLASAALVAPVVQATGLVIDTNTLAIAPTGKLDIKDNALIVHSTAYATVRAYVVLGNNGGDWLGKGVTSSVAAAEAANFLTTVGLIDNSDALAGYTTFVGHSVNPTASLAKYTYFGDADLNGLVDSTDYFYIDNGFGTVGSPTPLQGWINGDFDYSGAVDSTDYFYIDGAFAAQGAPILPAPPLAGSAVPEPSSLGLILLGLGVVANRRRK